MTFRFDNQVALITGAGSGLGKSHALYLASRGAKVVVNDIGGSVDGAEQSELPAKMVADQIKAMGGEAIANFDSVATPQGAQNIVDDALNHFGTIDLLINSAGILRDKTFLKMSLDDFEFVIQVHLMGTVYVTQAAFKIMKDNNFGRIVFTTSSAGLFGNFGQTNYSAAKMGLIGFMNSLKLEAIKYNILVNTVAPLAVTRMAQGSGIFPKEIASNLKPGMVSAIVAYLCSKACNSTGDIVSAGGGYYSRIQIVEGRGIVFDPKDNVTPEKIADQYSHIKNMDETISFNSVKDEILAILERLK